MDSNFDTLVVITPNDFLRLRSNYSRLIKWLPDGRLIFIGSDEVGRLVGELYISFDKDADLYGDAGAVAPGIGENACLTEGRNEVKIVEYGNRLGFINENDIIPFDDVHRVMDAKMEPLLKGRELPRGVTGWYYQQFLKMEYSRTCAQKAESLYDGKNSLPLNKEGIEEDKISDIDNEKCRSAYYMTWDGDTVPCKKIEMFNDEGKPYLDLKHEYNELYFTTMGRLIPGLGKFIEPSFISEHMLFNCDIMKKLIAKIESNDSIPGSRFYEKIINCIPLEDIQGNGFSEFETYGSFVCLTSPQTYKLREWHSFRLAGEFFDLETISDDDHEWLAHDFDAISFEKGMKVREDHKNLFDNKEYQSKLTAGQMLKIAQEEFKDGYIEKL